MAGRTYRTASGRLATVREPSVPDIPDELATASAGDAELREGVVHAGFSANDLDLSGRAAAGAEFDQCRYARVNFANVALRRATIRDVEFNRCDLANMRLRDSSVLRVAITASRMTGVSWLASTVRDVMLSGCRIDLASFAATKFTDVTFTNCRLDQANFGDADLSGIRFEDCNLTGAQFSGAKLTGTRFAGCDLTGISGVMSMHGAIITTSDAITLARIFADALGITIEDESPETRSLAQQP